MVNYHTLKLHKIWQKIWYISPTLTAQVCQAFKVCFNPFTVSITAGLFMIHLCYIPRNALVICMFSLLKSQQISSLFSIFILWYLCNWPSWSNDGLIGSIILSIYRTITLLQVIQVRSWTHIPHQWSPHEKCRLAGVRLVSWYHFCIKDHRLYKRAYTHGVNHVSASVSSKTGMLHGAIVLRSIL